MRCKHHQHIDDKRHHHPYSTVVARDSVRIILMVAALNGLAARHNLSVAAAHSQPFVHPCPNFNQHTFVSTCSFDRGRIPFPPQSSPRITCEGRKRKKWSPEKNERRIHLSSQGESNQNRLRRQDSACILRGCFSVKGKVRYFSRLSRKRLFTQTQTGSLNIKGNKRNILCIYRQ